ncbi:olfactory receptor family 5 subfamily M member 13 [Cricetulus griseus]
MLEKNYTAVTEFILLGLTDRAELQPVLFVVFLLIYLITVIGNVTMIFLIRSDTKLHTPMYFFLSHLSFVDLCYATNVTPQMLVNFLSKRKTISFIGCFIQFHFFIALVITDYYMLTVMAYDRYMAICKPLLYTSKMSRSVCISLVAAPYIYGFANGLAQTILMLRLTFCGPNEINHFYCADPPLMVLACSDTYVKETAMFVVAGSNLTCSLTIILISYIFIFSAILRIRSAEGRRKAFSTCGSHLVAVTVFYGTLFCMYLRPPSEKSVEQGKIVAVFYIFVSPMLNPLIYSLRNKDVKRAIRKVVEKEMFMNHLITRGAKTLPPSDRPELQPILFVLFLVIYLITVGGNLGMMVLIRVDSRLHTPMYYFLASLSCLDLCYSTNVTPKMLVNFLSEKKTISYAACLVQCYFFIAMVITEYYMLAVMAYDRYMAICNPLLYSSKMSKGVCVRLIAGPYIYGFLSGLMETMWTYRLTFCGSNVINHFYCADPPLIRLSCSDTFIKETSMFVVAGFNLSNSLLIILISYLFILIAILRMRSAEGRRKAFSTCGSHLVAVTVFYGTLFCMYVRPPTDKSVEQSKIIAVFYTFVSPMLNPIIYSLRNKDVKHAFRKLIRRNVLSK